MMNFGRSAKTWKKDSENMRRPSTTYAAGRKGDPKSPYGEPSSSPSTQKMPVYLGEGSRRLRSQNDRMRREGNEREEFDRSRRRTMDNLHLDSSLNDTITPDQGYATYVSYLPCFVFKKMEFAPQKRPN